MNRYLPRTLLWRIGFILMGAQIVILSLLGWIALNSVRDFHYGQVVDELARVEALIAAAPDDLPSLDAVIKEKGRLTGVRLTVLRADGVVLADSDADITTIENHRYGRSEIEDALTNGQGVSTRFSNTVKMEMMYLARRHAWPDVGTVVVRVSLPMTHIDQELSELRRQVIGAGLVTVVLTGLVVYFVSRRFSRQVEELAVAATRFAEGDLDYQVPKSGARELTYLADSLNSMGRELADRMTQLEAQQAEQRMILQSMSNGVLALDEDHRVVNINRAAERMLGVSAEAARGRLLQELVRHPHLSELVARLVSGEQASSTEIEFETGAGDRRVIEVRGEAMTSGEEQSQGVLLLLNDVTEEQRFEALRSDFAANVSHELRTPITNIKGYVETLQEVGWSDSKQAERFLSIIRSNSDRLAAIVEDVMSLTNLERPVIRDALEFEKVSASWLVESVADQFAQAAGNKDITLRIDEQEKVRVVGHARLLQQAVSNLVSNAIRYSPEGATVTLTLGVEDSMARIDVSDTGPGISKAHMSRLFERFYRVDKARSRELGGTGLGLAIVKHIANVHNGRIEVISAVGRGSTFSLFVPLAASGGRSA